MSSALQQIGQQTGAATSLIAASAVLEEAVHARTFGDAVTSLQSAQEWVTYAQQDLANAGFGDAALMAGKLATQLQGLADLSVPPDCLSLTEWQDQDLVPIQAVVAMILALPAAEQLVAAEEEQEALFTSGMFAFFSVLGLAGTILGAAAWIDWRQAHGGYPPPHAKATPVVSYRY